MSEKYTRNPNIKCLICSSRIYRRPSVIKASKGNIYCGQAFYGIACRREKPCVICSKPILRGLNKITCSRACSNKNRESIKYKIRRPKDKKDVGIIKLKYYNYITKTETGTTTV